MHTIPDQVQGDQAGQRLMLQPLQRSQTLNPLMYCQACRTPEISESCCGLWPETGTMQQVTLMPQEKLQGPVTHQVPRSIA